MSPMQVQPFLFVSTLVTALCPAQAGSAAGSRRAVTPDAQVARYTIPPPREPQLTRAREIALLRRSVKYVFVIYQENRSFDSYFGTFPGADGLYSQPAASTPGFDQTLIDTDGSVSTIHPFRIGPAEYAADTDDIDHSHPMIVAKMDIVGDVPRMDRFALTEERKYSRSSNPSLLAKQFGELSMAHEDGDTIPILWRYANRFVLFDHIFQQMTGPSTPGNLAIIGAQSGVTQWIRHPEEAYTGNGAKGAGVPVLNDADPAWPLPGQPSPADKKGLQLNLTYATIPLTLAGAAITSQVKTDADPAGDLDDVSDDIPQIAKTGKSPFAWGWFQEGYDREPTDIPSTDTDPLDAEGQHASYVTHHNGPQYFGYIANNPRMRRSMHGLKDFYDAIKNRSLPPQGGLFYVKGGGHNIMGLRPVDPYPAVQAAFNGDDDHPAYSDAQISEAAVAECVNAIAASPYWKHCAIIITWDDSEGDYDHVPPPVRSRGPDGAAITDGPRVPLLVISPYARVHAIPHDQGDHASVVKFADTVFGLIPLADLADEKAARIAAEKRGLENEGPYDDITTGVTDLLGAFDPARLSGHAPILPPSYAEVPEYLVRTLPQQTGYGWRQVGVEPVDYQRHIPNDIPADFNPRPKTEPTTAK